MIPVKGGTGRKISAKDYLETLPKDAKIVFFDPEEDYDRLKHMQFSPANPLDLRGH